MTRSWMIAVSPVWGLFLGLASCVTGTVYQRAEELQVPSPAPAAVHAGLSDPAWKVRCLAALACARTSDLDCIGMVGTLASTDWEETVRECAFEALVAMCDRGGREALASMSSREMVAVHWRLGTVERCGSPDSVFALMQLPPAPEARMKIGGEWVERPPSSPEAKKRYLDGLLRLRGPRRVVEARLRDVSSVLARIEEKARADLSEGLRLIAAAREDIAAERFESAERRMGEAAELGADVVSVRGEVAAARARVGEAKAAEALALARSGRLDEATRAAGEAEALDVNASDARRLIAAAEWKRLKPTIDHNALRTFALKHRSAMPDEARVRLVALDAKEAEERATSEALSLAETRCPALYEAYHDQQMIISKVNYAYSASGGQLSYEQESALVQALGYRSDFVRACKESIRKSLSGDACSLQVMKSLRAMVGKSKAQCIAIRAEQAFARVPFEICRKHAFNDIVEGVCMTMQMRAATDVLAAHEE